MMCCQAKYLVLVLLVVQNTCLVLLMRYSRTRPGTMYLGSTAVCCDEAMKLVTCLLILTFGYYCKKKESGGEYSQINSRESGEKEFDEEEFDEEDSEDGAVEQSEDISAATSFLGHLKEELQFDWRMVSLVLWRSTISCNLFTY
jgi:hypothetical protein